MARVESNWLDDTVYARGDQVKDPRVFTIHMEGMRIAVHRKAGCPASNWFLTCHPLQIEDRALKVQTMDDFDAVKGEGLAVFAVEAQAQAERLARAADRCQKLVSWKPRARAR